MQGSLDSALTVESNNSIDPSYNLIENTIRKFNTKSCVQFKRYNNEADYVVFRKNDG